jgi:hypothetical protein
MTLSQKHNMYKSYITTVLKHRYYVLIACFKLGLFWQGLIHDNSKLSFFELYRYARKFNGPKNELYEVERQRLADPNELFQYAWNNHIHHNKHHWQYWITVKEKVLNESSQILILDMPDKYIDEMICDWWAAAKAYKGPGLLPWWELNKFKIRLSRETFIKTTKRIKEINNVLNKRKKC